MKRRVFAFFMALCLMIGVLPAQSISVSAAPSTSIVTITIVDGSGNPLTGATVTATRTYLTPGGNQRTTNVALTNAGNGVYTFNTAIYYNGTTQYYTVNASKDGYPSATQHIDPDSRSVVVMLGESTVDPEPEPEPDQWVAFDMYYIANGVLPESFAAPGDAAKYGPSNNDVPFVTINVNITKLKSKEYADRVAYEENKNSNAYHFIPVGDTEAVTDEERVAIVKRFWSAVLECMDEASLEAFEETGLSDAFYGYALKNQNTLQNPDNHCDGLLTVTPPVYIVEMNEASVYFGGFANDKDTTQYTTFDQVTAAYSAHFKQGIEWEKQSDGSYVGEYIEGKYKYTLRITQTNKASATVVPSQGGSQTVPYARVTNEYYLAVFNSTVTAREQVQFTVTYTDGVTDKVFVDQVTDHKYGDAVPAFRGDTTRENYTFLGWVLQGGNGAVMSSEEAASLYVTRDLTFVAAYELKPQTFAATVEVILNGEYADNTATGERVDLTTVKDGVVGLYASADGVTFVEMEKTATGVYNAKLENGTYQLYYYDGATYTLTGHGQQLVINDAARTRYLFFNDVKYDVNGGVGGPAPTTEYYRTGDTVTVSAVVPTKDGFEFIGWRAEDGTTYAASALLDAAIATPYRLTAQWKKINKATVDVTIIVDGKSADGTVDKNWDREMTIELTYRPVDSNADYVEVVGKNYTDKDGYYIGTTVNDVTTTVYDNLFTDLDIAYEYAANAFMSEYEVISGGRSVTKVVDANGDVTYHVVIRMQYAPEMRMLEYTVVEDIDNDALVPTAVDVKILAYYNPSLYGYAVPDAKAWYPVTQHMDSTHDAVFDTTNANGDWCGHESYIVWAWEDSERELPYYYRVSAAGLTLTDGTELTLVSSDGINYVSLASTDGRYPAGAYTAVVSVDGGVSPDGNALTGAYFTDDSDEQMGDITITVYAHPYTVTFDPNGGMLRGTTANTVLSDQFFVPNVSEYVPTRGDNYVFDRWVLVDNPDKTVVAGEALTSDITLRALWKAPKAVEGLVTVGATYEQVNDNGTVTVQKIEPKDRPQAAVVLLQRIAPNGYFETIRSTSVTLDYTNEDYYYAFGTRAVGMAYYAFTDIPDDGSAYRVQLLLPNFVAMFQNEPESLTQQLDYPLYDIADYTVLWGETAPAVGTVNIHNHFDPDEFDLQYKVDALAIGNGFRPDAAEILVTYDIKPGDVAPSEWEVISQMKFEDGLHGDNVPMANGLGVGSTPVWISSQDGATYYQYGIRVQTTTVNGEKVPYTKDLPYTITYQAPTHYHYGGQEQLLIAKLIPNTYAIKYEIGGATMSGEYPTTHTWSYETALADVVPVLAGHQFVGWYLDKERTIPAGDAIAASVAKDTTLYAKWVQVMDVVDLTVIIDHTQKGDNGLANNYKKDLYAQLTSDLRTNASAENREYVAMDGYQRVYPDGLWHTHGDDMKQDIFQIPSFYTNLSSEYDYSVNVELEGYYEDPSRRKVEKIEQPDGSTLHKVTVMLKYDPDLLTIDFYVELGDGITADTMPMSAQVKITCWADDPVTATPDWDWFRISQHEVAAVTVAINPVTGRGEGEYSVWQWYDEEQQIPYYYRLEVVQLNFADGSTLAMNTLLEDQITGGAGYTATVETAGGKVPQVPDADKETDLEGVYGAAIGGAYVQQGTLGAVIDLNRVVFHANNADYAGNDAFRTYYYEKMPQMGGSEFVLTNGTVPRFFDLPAFSYETHNEYIFKGWYMDPVSEDEPFNWDAKLSGNVDVYAHWIETGTVEQEAADTKQYTDLYQGYDLVGVQIRDIADDRVEHYGDAASGLRFITVLKEDVYAEINEVNGGEAEYGFVMAKTSTAQKYANGAEGYTLQYNDVDANGVNTTQTYKYVQNMVCSGVEDHFNGETYRLYTAVITYEGVEGEALEQAYAMEFLARSYIHYTDANGLERVYYNNYTGTNVYHGCSASFAAVRG